MRSKLFDQRPKTAKTSMERWVRILPDEGDGYVLYDVFQERLIGRILVDRDDNWVYDGHVLTPDEQEELAGTITGNQKEMDQLIKNL
jgi:hypothetical protein